MIDVDPDRWLPSREYVAKRKPKPGMKVAWRYAVWQVTDVHLTPECDWTDREAAQIAGLPEQYREDNTPRTIVLQRECGPNLSGIPDGQPVHLHLGVHNNVMDAVARRYQTCSCHRHPWPCIDYDRDRLIAGQAKKTERLLAGSQPGVCAYCVEPISARQKTIVFPEPSLLVPGAPGPTFHANRSDCWVYGAHKYETEHRLRVYPEATRIASCPGVAFVHMIGQAIECTAGPGCTGLHGPGRIRPGDGNCATRVRHYTDLANYPRPLSDCGYRNRDTACLGAESGPCEPLPPGIADLLGGQP